jgi:iron complex outermembrane receptor protein
MLRIVFTFFFIWTSLNGQVIRVLDAWTLQPVAGCELSYGSHVWNTDTEGFCNIGPVAIDSLNVSHAHYFEIRIAYSDQKESTVYLQPVESAPVIYARAFSPQKPLFLPASTSYIKITSADKARAVSADQVLREEAGISFKSYGADGQNQVIALRGFSGEQTQVLFDGIPINSPQLGLLNFNTVSLEGIGSIHIYRGGSPLYGGSGAIGGTINFLPRLLSDSLSFNIAQSYSSLNNYTTSFGAGFPVGGFKQNIDIALSVADNNYDTKHLGKEVDLQNRDYESRSILWQAEYDITDNFLINFLLNNYVFDGGSPKSFSGEAAEAGNSARISHDNTLTRLRLSHKAHNGNTDFHLYRRNDWNHYEDRNTQINALHFIRESGLILRNTYALSRQFVINSGAEFSSQGVSSSELGDKKRGRAAVYALADILVFEGDSKITPDINFNLSARFEKMESASVLLPGAGLTFGLNSMHLFISAGKNHRNPTFNELYWPGLGNKDLLPEKSNNYETGIGYKERIDNFTVNSSAAVYYSKVHNQIKWLPVNAGDFIPQNILEITSKGAEISGDLNWNDRILLKLNYTYTDAQKTKADSGDNTVGNRVPYSSLHSLFAATSLTLDNFMIGAKWDFRSFHYPTFANDINNFLPSTGITTFKMSYSQPLTDSLYGRVFFFIENVFDTNYQLYIGYPMPPRTYKINLTLNY